LQVRSYIRTIAKPGIPLTQLCETLEDSVRNLIEARGLDAGEGLLLTLLVTTSVT
jgi:methionyl aminopeptidase